MLESGSGWHSGISDEVRFAARMPASRAACSGSPFFTVPARICRSASRDIEMDPRATASRVVTALSPTSTIVTRPRASTCDSRRSSVLRAFAFPPFTLPSLNSCLLPSSVPAFLPCSFLHVRLLLRQKEGQALERDGEINALELHVGRHLERAW